MSKGGRQKGEKGVWWHDKEIAKKFKGRPTPRSGGMPGFVGDVIVRYKDRKDLILENKFSTSKIRLSVEYILRFFEKVKLKRSTGAIILRINNTEKALVETNQADTFIEVKTKTLLITEGFLKTVNFVKIGSKYFKLIEVDKIDS